MFTKHSSSRSSVFTTLLLNILKSRKNNKKFYNDRVQWLFVRTVTSCHSATLADTLGYLKVSQLIPIETCFFLITFHLFFFRSRTTHTDLAINSNTSLESFILHLSNTTHPKTRSTPRVATRPLQKYLNGWKSYSANNNYVRPVKYCNWTIPTSIFQ